MILFLFFVSILFKVYSVDLSEYDFSGLEAFFFFFWVFFYRSNYYEWINTSNIHRFNFRKALPLDYNYECYDTDCIGFEIFCLKFYLGERFRSGSEGCLCLGFYFLFVVSNFICRNFRFWNCGRRRGWINFHLFEHYILFK
jgi:hypothetical protein